MSGSSLDGIDLVAVNFKYDQNDIEATLKFEIIAADCISFGSNWIHQLQNAKKLSVPDFLELHTLFGRYLGSTINDYIIANHLQKKNINAIASHGHTIYHNPTKNTSFQLGEGAQIAAITGIRTIADLRNMDVALGGQGAPIVPISERQLFHQYAFCLNIGGIANITINTQKAIAFDICPANQVLNYFAQKLGKLFDDKGAYAKSGIINTNILDLLLSNAYLHNKAPKSLDNSFSIENVIPILDALTPQDALCTAVEYIALSIKNALVLNNATSAFNSKSQLLITGGGAFNSYLIERIQYWLKSYNVTVVIPAHNIIAYKEALAMALIGLYRLEEKPNVLASVTGAQYDNIGGSLWLP